jgi:hypothetical protein
MLVLQGAVLALGNLSPSLLVLHSKMRILGRSNQEEGMQPPFSLPGPHMLPETGNFKLLGWATLIATLLITWFTP